MKTKDDIILEAENHFGVNVFSNDDGISRRINHYAMDLWAKEMRNAQFADGSKAVVSDEEIDTELTINEFKEFYEQAEKFWNIFLSVRKEIYTPTGYVIETALKIAFIRWMREKLSTPTQAEVNEYEYEMFFESRPDDFCKIDGWYPIATDRIRKPERIEEFLKSGLLRKITNKQ